MRLSLTPIDCTDCGLCCDGQEALPVGYWLGILADEDERTLPPELKAELQLLADRFDRTGWPSSGEPCVWFDAETKGCRHYDYRPDICQDFELGGESCLEIRAARDQPRA